MGSSWLLFTWPIILMILLILLIGLLLPGELKVFEMSINAVGGGGKQISTVTKCIRFRPFTGRYRQWRSTKPYRMMRGSWNETKSTCIQRAILFSKRPPSIKIIKSSSLQLLDFYPVAVKDSWLDDWVKCNWLYDDNCPYGNWFFLK